MTKTRYPRADALAVAKELCDALKPVCERLIVAGSLRRRKPDVGDVEILFVPKVEERSADLFGAIVAHSLADEALAAMLDAGTLARRLLAGDRTAWGAKNKLATHAATGMPVDLFATTEDSWWNYLVCRTGPADSNTRIATRAKEAGYQWNPYGPGFTHLATGDVSPMRSEREVFEFVGLPYLDPWDRR